MCEWGLAAVEELDHARPDAPAQAHREGLDLVGGRRGGASARTSSSSSATAAGRRAGAQQLGRGRGRGRGTGLSIRYLPYMATYLQERGFSFLLIFYEYSRASIIMFIVILVPVCSLNTVFWASR